MASIAIAGIGGWVGSAGLYTTLGSMALAALGRATAPDQEGPRMKNLQPPNSSVGGTIPKGFGKTPAVGTIIWATPIQEHKKKESAGKGGGPDIISYSYTGSCTLSFGVGPVTRVAKMMLGQTPVYDWNGGDPLGDKRFLGSKKNGAYFTTDASTSTLTSNNGKVRIRLGTETQMPDSAEETTAGAGNASAYRGQVVITFQDLSLDSFGGSWPQVTVLLEEPTTNVASIATWICKEAGLSEDDLDFGEIADTHVNGFVLPQQQSAATYLQQLGVVAMCDFVERDWKLRAMKRGRDISLTIPQGDLQSHDYGSELPDLSLVRADELTLPRQVDVTYIDSARNYTTATATAWREVDGEANAVQSLDLSNVVLSNAEARQYAEIALYATLSQRSSTSLVLPGSYAYLSNADVVNAETDFGTFPVMLQTSQESLFGTVAFNVKSYSKSAYSYPKPGDVVGLQPSLVQVTGDYYYAIIDTNLLVSNGSNVPLLLIAVATPEGANFNDVRVTSNSFSVSQSAPSGNVMVDLGRTFSADNSTTNDNQFNPGYITVKNSANLGEVVGTLGAYPYGAGSDPGSFDLIDDVNSITVDMIRGTLSSLDQDQFLFQTQGAANSYIIGKEIVKVRDWSYVGTFSGRKRYTGSYIYRGRRGTEGYSDQHHPNEAFVDVTSSVYYAQLLQGSIGQSIELSTGDNTSANQSISLSISGNSLKPYSPHAVRAERDASGNMTIVWARRSRGSDNNWWTTGSAPTLGEPAESYDLEIVGDDDIVLRSYSALTASSLSYSATDQISDFGSIKAPGTLHIKIYQNSAVVGRGYVAEISV